MKFPGGPPKNEGKFKSVLPKKNGKIFKGNNENDV